MSQNSPQDAGPRLTRGAGLPPKWVPVAIVVIGSLWACHYVWHTNQNSYGDQDTVLFINFLIWPLLASAGLVVLGALRGRTEEAPVGLSDHRRLLLLVSVPVYGIGLLYAGFIIASVIFLLVLLPVLGVRKPFLLAGLCALVVAIIWFGFFNLMSVPVPLWPHGFN